ncbi:hypothetical protein A2U01_0057128, partial [Trifolium medium]|nr:hypothetical protein [Trifolium medium]
MKDPIRRVAVPSNAVSGPSSCGCNSGIWCLSFENRFWYMMLQELPWSISTLEMFRLAIVTVMSSDRSPLGVPFTRSESENPRVGLLM